MVRAAIFKHNLIKKKVRTCNFFFFWKLFLAQMSSLRELIQMQMSPFRHIRNPAFSETSFFSDAATELPSSLMQNMKKKKWKEIAISVLFFMSHLMLSFVFSFRFIFKHQLKLKGIFGLRKSEKKEKHREFHQVQRLELISVFLEY